MIWTCWLARRDKRVALAVGVIVCPNWSSSSIRITCLPCAARKSAISKPTIPPPTTRTFCPGTCCPAKTDQADTIFSGKSVGMSTAAGCAPIASITTSGFAASMSPQCNFHSAFHLDTELFQVTHASPDHFLQFSFSRRNTLRVVSGHLGERTSPAA